MNRLKNLQIGNLRPRLPIIQGGMGVGISMAGLASAVADEGGVGVIAAAGIGMLERDAFAHFAEANIRALKNEIRKAKAKTKGLLGVNVMVALSNFADLVRAALEEKVDFIFAGAGLPLNLPELPKSVPGAARTKLVPIISSARAAAVIVKKWVQKYDYVPDAFVVEGPLAGGHLGFKPEQIQDPAFSLPKLVDEVVAEVRHLEAVTKKEIPVIAAGGVFTGADIRRYLDRGASGVQMATRFVGTEECDASRAFKETYLKATREDLIIIRSPVGMPGRAIRNQFIDDVDAGKRKPFKCPYHCIVTCHQQTSPYCIALALTSALRGRLKSGFAFAGANAYRVNDIVTVKELIATLVDEYTESASA